MKIRVSEHNMQHDNFALLKQCELLEEEAPIISVVGAGGKTSLILELAAEFVHQGKSVIISTTTKMLYPLEALVVLDGKMSSVQQALLQGRVVWVGSLLQGGGKIGKVPDEFLQELCGLGIPILLEADGARRLPCKAPADHEPVLVPETTLVLGVMGLDALGAPIAERCFRPERVAGLLNKEMAELLCEEDMAVLAVSMKGLKKNIAAHMRYYVILNKADNAKRLDSAEKIIRRLAEQGFSHCLVTSFPQNKQK